MERVWVSFRGDENVLELQSDDGFQTVSVQKCCRTGHLKTVNSVFTFILPPFFKSNVF